MCPFTNNLLLAMSSSFCTPNSCHKYCPNHYSIFRPITLKGVYRNTIKRLSSLQHNALLFNQSDALKTHPILKLMHSHHRPKCALTPILIPEPSPHIKLFLISPYNSLRICPRLNHLPLATSTILRSNEGRRSSTDALSLL